MFRPLLRLVAIALFIFGAIQATGPDVFDLHLTFWAWALWGIVALLLSTAAVLDRVVIRRQ